MIEESATVLDTLGDSAWVETRRRSTCDSCSVNKGCGSATLAKVLGNRRSVVQVINPVGAVIGDEVVLGLHESALVRGSLAVYGIPLGAMLGFALVGEMLTAGLDPVSREAAVILCGVAGLIGGFHWVYRFGKRIRRDSRYQPVILRRVTAITTGDRQSPARVLI